MQNYSSSAFDPPTKIFPCSPLYILYVQARGYAEVQGMSCDYHVINEYVT